MFSRPPLTEVDDAHLEVSVTPSASAFYAGETFSAVITLRNTRVAPTAGGSLAHSNPTHLDLLPGARPKASTGTSGSPDRAWSPAGPEWRGEHARRPSQGHSRRTQSLAVGKGTLSPQEMVWALSGGNAPLPNAGPPLPPRRTSAIPTTHPHARKSSVASSSAFANSPPRLENALPSDDEGVTQGLVQLDSPISTSDGASKSTRATPSASPALPDVIEELSPPGTRGATSPVSPSFSPASSQGTAASTPRRSPVSPPWRQHGRSPSLNHSSSSLLSPPTHPSTRSRPPLQVGTTTVLWAHARLVARFAPSHQYIPPDPLLPLRAKMLHQPVGSGSLSATDERTNSRWSLSFGTGSIGQGTQPSLTGSLFGLAKGFVSGGSGGSLEEERKRVWSTQDLPVLDTSRSLLGVDIKLGEGETREFLYTIQLPTVLPPAFKGRALRFSYELALTLSVALPGGGKRQRNKEIQIPLRVWPNVSLGPPSRTYNVLEPVIQTTEHGSVVERPLSNPSAPAAHRQHTIDPPQKPDTLVQYARQLVDSLDDPEGANRIPPSPSAALNPLSPALPSAKSPTFLMAPEEHQPRLRPRAVSIVAGDDELVAEAQRCGEAVEILSRHSPKASYDIRQDGEVVAVLTLVKTTYRLGETVLGVVTFNDAPDRRVLKLTAYLESHEVIPETLLPPSASTSGRVRQPELRRNHAESRTAYAQFMKRTSFSLDIPSDATPGFSLSAGDGKAGGLEWRLRIAFLVASLPSRKSMDHRRDAESEVKVAKSSASLHLEPTEGDTDNTAYSAAPSLVPLLAYPGGWAQAKAETVECQVPIQVLAGSTAFVVRPSLFTV